MSKIKLFLLGLLCVLLPLNSYAYNPRAKDITVTPAGSISSTNVQDAFEELDREKLSSFTETDPIFGAWATANDHHSNWDTAYGWGNHASAGYLTSSALTPYSTKAQADLLYKPIGYTPDLSAYSTKAQADLLYLGLSAQAADSATLQGHNAAYFQIAGSYLTDAPSDSKTYGRKNGSWSEASAGTMVYPDAGIPLSTGSAWGTSITNNSSNWNTAYGWGNHASAGYLKSGDITGKEDSSNKVSSISSASTDTQYPSAKLVYDQLSGKQASGSYLTSVAGAQLDNVWSSTGILTRTGAATYGVITDSHSNWDAAYSAIHSAVTLDTNADDILKLTTQEVGLQTQAANTVLAGRVSAGTALVPTFRSLVALDIPDLSATYLPLHSSADDSAKLNGQSASYYQTALDQTTDLIVKSLTVGKNGSSGTAGVITLRDGANPGTTNTISYTKWADLEGVNGLVKCNGSGDYSAASAGTDFIAPYGSTTAKYFHAAPNASDGTPSFRLIVASDIPELSYAPPLGVDDNYVTDAEKIVIGNTSGTNSGDNSANSLYSGLASSKADVGQQFYIGTTQVAINRGSGALSLTGVNVDGSSGSCSGNASTATTLATARAINGQDFNGSAPITVPVNNANDATNADYFMLFTSTQGGNYAALTSTGIKYHPSTGILTATGFFGPLTGNVTGNASGSSGSCTGLAATATALATPRAINGVNFDGTAPITILPRTTSAANYTTDTGTSLNCDNMETFAVTAQAGALKFNNPSGTPHDGQKLAIRVLDNGGARALTWDTQFVARGVALPSITVASKVLYVGFIWNANKSTWDCVASAQEA